MQILTVKFFITFPFATFYVCECVVIGISYPYIQHILWHSLTFKNENEWIDVCAVANKKIVKDNKNLCLLRRRRQRKFCQEIATDAFDDF